MDTIQLIKSVLDSSHTPRHQIKLLTQIIQITQGNQSPQETQEPNGLKTIPRPDGKFDEIKQEVQTNDLCVEWITVYSSVSIKIEAYIDKNYFKINFINATLVSITKTAYREQIPLEATRLETQHVPIELWDLIPEDKLSQIYEWVMFLKDLICKKSKIPGTRDIKNKRVTFKIETTEMIEPPETGEGTEIEEVEEQEEIEILYTDRFVITVTCDGVLNYKIYIEFDGSPMKIRQFFINGVNSDIEVQYTKGKCVWMNGVCQARTSETTGFLTTLNPITDGRLYEVIGYAASTPPPTQLSDCMSSEAANSTAKWLEFLRLIV
jgi:hypothetical protein